MHAYLSPSLGFAFSWAGFIGGAEITSIPGCSPQASLEPPAVSERSPGLTLIRPAWSWAPPCTNRCGQGGMCVFHWLGLTDPPATWTKDSGGRGEFGRTGQLSPHRMAGEAFGSIASTFHFLSSDLSLECAAFFPAGDQTPAVFALPVPPTSMFSLFSLFTAQFSSQLLQEDFLDSHNAWGLLWHRGFSPLMTTREFLSCFVSHGHSAASR